MSWRDDDPAYDPVYDDDVDEGPSAEDLRRFGDDDVVCEECGAGLYDDADVCPVCGAFQMRPEVSDSCCGMNRAMRNPWVATIVVVLLVYALVSWYM